MDLVRTKWMEGKVITVREYLKLMADGILPRVDRIYLGTEKITYDELINNHINDEAVFSNDAKYEYDEDGEWVINRYELLLEEK